MITCSFHKIIIIKLKTNGFFHLMIHQLDGFILVFMSVKFEYKMMMMIIKEYQL